MTFDELLQKYRKVASSNEDLGSRFERLIKAYLLTDPLYSVRIKNVWRWNEFFGRKDSGRGNDTGIDLVAQTTKNEFWAIQCKCWNEDSYISKGDVDSFLSKSSQTFFDETLQKISFTERYLVSTTNKWSQNATDVIKNQNPPVTIIKLSDLQNACVNWGELDKGSCGELARIAKKELRPHQIEALNKTYDYFKEHDRGQLIMACGTGKTLTSLRIAEKETDSKGLILVLVPSIALLGQILREWSANAQERIYPICICSDPKVSKKKMEDGDSFSVVYLASPASTDPDEILRQFEISRLPEYKGMTVFFSTYQSIEKVSEAQKELLKNGFSEFDLVICDEAHRTTGVKLPGKDESAFVRIHEQNFIKAKKRLYMTATPRLYSSESQSRAAQAQVDFWSMDDPKRYGKEIYRLGFGAAVEKKLLADYKVLILTIDDKNIPLAMLKMVTDKLTNISDGRRKRESANSIAAKLIGCINALSKNMLGDGGTIRASDPKPMHRAVAFCSDIDMSETIRDIYNTAPEPYFNSLSKEKQLQMVSLDCKHIDGTMSALDRDDLLNWLKASQENENECRILTNVRCLSEGVDVPSLDAVMFLSAKNSEIDVVQAVGRVMRIANGKNYGYIIIPVFALPNEDAGEALEKNEQYAVVWDVLKALRAHDDRFNATINKIELNKKRPRGIIVGGADTSFDKEGNPINNEVSESDQQLAIEFTNEFKHLQNVVFAKMVDKVGDRRYWEQWAKEVAGIAERQIDRICDMIKVGKYKTTFEQFLSGLQKNINPSITEIEAIEMLSQHIITKPVFEALFEGYSFVKNNPISVSMQSMLDLLETQAIEKDTDLLQKFYDSVKLRASDIDNAEGKQRIIIELYDKFFKTAFPKMVERLGIVYTPVEVVDFIIHSVNDVLKQEFGRAISDENVNILDPFTGTGTFITRLIQSCLIDKKDLRRKYAKEIFANEIVLLAYYTAAVNIENAFHDCISDFSVFSKETKFQDYGYPMVADSEMSKWNVETAYTPFGGICLTDTFQLGETDDANELASKLFPQNFERVQRQKKTPITVIMGNPPYSVGQKSTNDNAANQEYHKLNREIEATYAKLSNATSSRSTYDAYIKAFRWSTDRLGNNDGIIAFVSNGAWLDSNSTDGFRKCLEKEFSSIYVFNLRGNARTSGEQRRKEKGNVFGEGSRTPIAITLLVKRKNQKQSKAKIYYHDIGDYLTREEKLKRVKEFRTISNMELSELTPNEHGDWLNQRNDIFSYFISITPEKKFEQGAKSMFVVNSLGLNSNRDTWVYNFSLKTVINNMRSMVKFYNSLVGHKINYDPKKISWSSSLLDNQKRGKIAQFEENKIVVGLYRPFTKQRLYFGEMMIHRRGQFEQFFPASTHKNLIICVSGVGASKDFSAIITDVIPDIQLQFNGQCFPLYYYEENKTQQGNLFDKANEKKYIRRDAISDFILKRCKEQYGKNVTKEDIFYYVYGFLHSPKYREVFASDLKKMLPRLPLVEDVRDFWAFSKAGRALAELHLNYENVGKLSGVVEKCESQNPSCLVKKMRFGKNGKEVDKSKIIYNSQISLENIPSEAYEYVVNGKSAIEWIMERYQVTTHKESGIVNNPNDWAKEMGKPRYILDLLHSVINLSVLTVKVVHGLPGVRFGDGEK